jgi:hypothetical protein
MGGGSLYRRCDANEKRTINHSLTKLSKVEDIDPELKSTVENILSCQLDMTDYSATLYAFINEDYYHEIGIYSSHGALSFSYESSHSSDERYKEYQIKDFISALDHYLLTNEFRRKEGGTIIDC